MGSSLCKLFVGNRVVRILFLGLNASGKTTVLYRLKFGEVLTTFPTHFSYVETFSVNTVEIAAWDVGLRDKGRALWRDHYPVTKGIVFLVDTSDKNRFPEAKEELSGLMSEDGLRGTPILVLANKQDTPDAMTPEQISEELYETLRGRIWSVFGVSATYIDQKSTGLTEAFDWLRDAIARKEMKHEVRKWLPLHEADDSKKECEEIEDDVSEWSLSSLVESFKKIFYRISR